MPFFDFQYLFVNLYEILVKYVLHNPTGITMTLYYIAWSMFLVFLPALQYIWPENN